MSQDPQLSVDEDWKEQAAADGEEEVAPPPADFAALVQLLSTQAMVGLGWIPLPGEKEIRPRLPLAKHFIDLLGVLQEKTRGGLTGDEAQGLEAAVHQLRMAYVEAARTQR